MLVGALGHMFGSNPERGVFRSTDGGKTWTKTLFIDADTGVVDLAADPAQPNIVFAAAWQARNYPWLQLLHADHRCRAAQSTDPNDGGVTWQRLGGDGWPTGKLGRIGLAVTHLTNGATRVYASIDSAEAWRPVSLRRWRRALGQGQRCHRGRDLVLRAA